MKNTTDLKPVSVSEIILANIEKAFVLIGIVIALLAGCAMCGYAISKYKPDEFAYWMFGILGLACIVPLIITVLLAPIMSFIAVLALPCMLDEIRFMRRELKYYNDKACARSNETVGVLKSLDRNQAVVGNYVSEQICAINTKLGAP